MHDLRKLLWRILGFDYETLLRKNDFTLLKDDKFLTKGVRSYDNGAKVWRWSKAPLVIGKYCSIANNVNFIVDEGYHTISSITNFPLASNLFKESKDIHGIEKDEYFSKFNQREGIYIGHDVWIGMGATILPGVKIGNGVTIAANAVVTNNIGDFCVVAGSPARLIKKKFEDPQITSLNKIAWWNWEVNVIKNRLDDFYLPINEFIVKHKK